MSKDTTSRQHPSALLAQIDRDLAAIKRHGDSIEAKQAEIDEILARIDATKDKP